MKVLRVHQIEMLVAVLFVLLVVCFYEEQDNVFSTEVYSAYNNNWNCKTDHEEIIYEQLPEEIEDAKWVMLSRPLTGEMRGEEYVGFYTIHQKVEAYIGGVKIYEKAVPRGTMAKSPGKCWNFIRMKESYQGKRLVIKLTNCYSDKDMNVPDFYRGAKSAIMMNVVRENTLALLLSVILLVIGSVMAAVWSMQGKRIYLHRGIVWLGFFTIHLAIWSGIETHVLQLMWGRELLFGEIASMSIKLMVCPAIRFIQVSFHAEENKILNGLCIAGIIDFIVSFVCQFFGWADYKETMWITYLLGVIAAVVSMVIIFRYLVHDRKKLFQKRKAIWVNVAGLSILAICVLADIMNYYYKLSNDRAIFTRFGWLVYIVLLGVQLLSESAQLIKAGRKLQSIKEEAEQDGLTKLKNRKCFEEDMIKIPMEEYPGYSIVMFDLNDMKMMNDMYGHSMGDCYIITGSEIIRDVFGEFGEIYRIGGDEFCLISNALEEEEFLRRNERMCEWMRSLKGAQIKDFMQIAAGYAKYEPDRDVRLWDVYERADQRMYQRKKEMKKKIK